MTIAHLTMIGIALHLLAEMCLVLRVMTRAHRDPASRIAWVAVIVSVPGLGMAAYLFFGEVNIGHRRVDRIHEILSKIPPVAEVVACDSENAIPVIPDQYQHLFHAGKSISGFLPLGGNTAELLQDSNAVIDAMIADIDKATDHVHVLFYIWLPDNNGLRMVEALIRATKRGVACRAIVDDLGSRSMIRSEHWSRMASAGVSVATALPIGSLLIRPLVGRLDLRNHRKIVVIDGAITYCGSQNCADAEFLVKAKYAPWVDAVLRFEGPIVRQNQQLFIGDWMSSVDDDLTRYLREPVPAPRPGFPAQVIGTGPTARNSAMSEMFESLFFAARHELTVTTPYYVPDSSIQNALCAAAWRGVKTKIIFPARNDSFIVGAASRSYYQELLDAGVEIYEYQHGVLHTKSLTLDGEVTLIGSANMDRRSFELNYENNILFYDQELTGVVRQRQQQYLDNSQQVTKEMVEAWSFSIRLWNNTLATLGPIL
ncbi:MAG: cardiolipin synthase [Pirellulales bacterium]